MSKIKKLQKPIEYDIHLKYRCKKCGLDHWLSYKEACTKNFKVVCACGLVFKVKQVHGFKLKFEDTVKTQPKKQPEVVLPVQEKTPQVVAPIVEDKPVVSTNSRPLTIPSELLDKSVKLLLSYGFTKAEATQLVTSTYFSVPVDDYATLVKYTLQSLGEQENGINNTSTL